MPSARYTTRSEESTTFLLHRSTVCLDCEGWQTSRRNGHIIIWSTCLHSHPITLEGRCLGHVLHIRLIVRRHASHTSHPTRADPNRTSTHTSPYSRSQPEKKKKGKAQHLKSNSARTQHTSPIHPPLIPFSRIYLCTHLPPLHARSSFYPHTKGLLTLHKWS